MKFTRIENGHYSCEAGYEIIRRLPECSKEVVTWTINKNGEWLDTRYTLAEAKQSVEEMVRKDMIITVVVDGHEGTAEIKWLESSQYAFAHYGAFISVPFQSSKWVNMFVYDKADIEGAKRNAQLTLTEALKRCTLF